MDIIFDKFSMKLPSEIDLKSQLFLKKMILNFLKPQMDIVVKLAHMIQMTCSH